MVTGLKSLVVAAFACAAVAVGAPSALADESTGSYTVRGACPTVLTPTEAGRGGWYGSAFLDGADLRSGITTCGSDGVFGLDLSTGWAGPSAGVIWSFLAPEPTKIDRVRFERRVRVSQGYRYSFATAGLGSREFTSGASVSNPAPPTEWTPGTFELYGGSWLNVILACVDPTACIPQATQQVLMRGFEADLVDPAAPTIQYAITTDQAPPSTFSVVVDAADKGSGVKTATVLLDGVTIGRTSGDGTCAASVYTVPAPCPAGAHISVPLAREALKRGTGQLEVEVADAAGNRVRTPAIPLRRFSYVRTSQTPLPNPAKPGALTLAFKGTTKTKLRNRYPAPPTITGTVRSTSGESMPGVPVQLDTRLLVHDGGFAPLKTVRTDKTGTFSLRLPRGPSREIQATVLGSDVAFTAVLRTSVTAPVRLTTNRKSTRNHRTVEFTGSVPGTPKGAHTRIDLQTRAGGHWHTFASPTLRNRHFGAKYTFTRTFSPSTYRFRALLRADDDFPFAAGKSREVRIHVRP